MLRQSLFILLIIYLLPVLAVSQKIAWPFDDYYGENLVYIHAVANYELHPTWHEKWENNLFRQTMLRLNFASISNTELLSDAHFALNEELSRGFWFRYTTSYYATHHRNEQDNFFSIGFEKSIYRCFSIYAYGNPHFEKENIDVQYGLSFTNKDRTNYVRLSYVDVDIFWNDKNNIKSYDIKKPWQYVWEANLRVGPLRFFSRGRYDNGYERIFEIEPGSSDFDCQDKKIDDMLFKLYYYRNSRSFLELKYSRYSFTEAKSFDAPSLDYDYMNQIDVYKIGYITPVGEDYRLRFGSHAVFQKATAQKYGAHDYRHTEIIPFIFAEMFAGPGIVEAGYMLSFQNWDYKGLLSITNPQRDTCIDKIKLAYTFNFKDRAYLQLAVSHVTTIWGFGGGNVQFWLEL